MKRNWEYKKLGDVCTLITKGTTPTSIGFDFTEDGVSFIKIESLTDDGDIRPSMVAHISEECNNALKRSQLEEFDILYSIAGALGRVAVVPRLILPANTNQALAIIRLADKNPIFIQFLKNFLHSKSVLSSVMKLKVGVAQQNLSLTQIRDFLIPVPPLSEQSRIVAELDLLTGIIDKQNAQLKELDNLAQAIFYDMFGDPIENPKGWNVKNLGSVCDFKNGLNFAPDETGEKYYLIGVSDFQTKSRLEYNQSLKTIELNKPLSEEYLLVDDDILFVRSNGNKDLIARNVLVAIKGLKVTYSGFCIRARVKNNDVLPFFLNSLLKLPSAHNALTASGHGCNIANLNQKTLDGFQLVLPPLTLQQSFAEKIQSIEKQKETIRASIADTQKLLDYTMDKYFG